MRITNFSRLQLPFKIIMLFMAVVSVAGPFAFTYQHIILDMYTFSEYALYTGTLTIWILVFFRFFFIGFNPFSKK